MEENTLGAQEEDYSPGGIGQNNLPCYICNKGGEKCSQPDMATFVKDREAARIILEMYQKFGLKATLDYRTNEPDWIQIKIGACEKHLPNLEKLFELCSEDNKIDCSKIVQSLLE